MNADIRANPSLDSPYFDLAGHLGSRAYCIHNMMYPDSGEETSGLLDIGVKDLLPSPFFAPPLSPPKGTTFELRPAEGTSGVGMFAARNIPAGGLILVERPILIAPYIIALESAPESEIFAALLRRLPPDTVAHFMTLANCKPPEECTAIEGIMRTNAIAVSLPVPDDVPYPELPTHRALFLNTSRCNHSCSPNAKWHWDAPSFSLSLKALRPIPAGHEITVAYIDPTSPRAERRAQLKDTYAFSCRCAACARPSAAVAQSDAARAELAAFWAAVLPFEAWCRDARLPDYGLVDAHARAYQLIEAEGLQTLGIGKHLDAIAMGYGALRDVAQFRVWAARARDARLEEDDAVGARVLEEWIREPETFPVWGWRESLLKASSPKASSPKSVKCMWRD
ncbi:hypothetical protein B0H15DRAFT_776709 [Mycena belliarum]|uniref:SET domain-containing protein n=1 Tax=Mycena belliarum TaxID=1033014 RepID=A0AAD6XT22_9AGAR|nr:hypothetical protein B0H15DRAFT_776709 [Mycena belliae]